MRDEGTIKYRLDYNEYAFPSKYQDPALGLISVRNRLFRQNLIGVYPDGIGFGNLSVLLPGKSELASRRFLITGTQTGHLPELTFDHLSVVTYCNAHENRVICEGPARASSEAMTHDMIYSLSESIGAVIHVHHPELWSLLKYKVPTTGENVPYGTPQMAEAVWNLYENGDLKRTPFFVMAGHEDGFAAFGRSLEAALEALHSVIRQIRPDFSLES